ncbi:hypothetical protein GV829_04505 [Sphingomonas lacunae]|uniref:Uncharacterized protein n=1 Tax=Sphingomonas lacunae TaxID=2698828 RepID=A0A6M4ASV8_9SPHN|nr:hypothetical protein [Sphingomonas lacunae]QJQ31796.1 hypothetical protein GV829_04505 [Sphingomonas lacunae]
MLSRLNWRYGWRINELAARLGRRLIRWSQRDCNSLLHARDEWALSFPGDCEMQRQMGEHVLDMVAMFSAEGHSGGSASYALHYINAALRFEPFSPLTGADHEWNDLGGGRWQNRRCSRVFKDPDGRAYDIEGKVFEDATGRYTSQDSRVYVTFPYVPHTEIVAV